MSSVGTGSRALRTNRRGVIAAPVANRGLATLRQTLADDEKFNAGAFSQALEKFKTAVLVKGP